MVFRKTTWYGEFIELTLTMLGMSHDDIDDVVEGFHGSYVFRTQHRLSNRICTKTQMNQLEWSYKVKVNQNL